MAAAEGIGEAKGAFRSHHRYLHAWVRAAAETYAPGRRWTYVQRVPIGIVGAVVADSAARKIQAKACNTQIIKRLMFNAWGTELHLALHAQLVPQDDDREILSLANQWSVVQAYYAVEKGTCALVVAKGDGKPESHAKTRKVYLDHWVGRPYGPWGMAFGAEGIKGAPPDAELQLDHNWQAVRGENCWAFLVKCLKTTRWNELVERRLKDAREQKGKQQKKEWQEQERARLEAGRPARAAPEFRPRSLTREESATVIGGTRAATFLDYLYRLRIRSNYEDTRMFTEGPVTAREARQMHWWLTRLVGWTLLLSELWIRRYVGPEQFDQMADEWLGRKVAANAGAGLAERRQLFPRGL